jgi:hypothetical protein
LNWYNGDETSYRNYFGLDGGTPPLPGGNMQQWKITWANGASLRQGPGIAFMSVQTIAVNTIVNVQKVQVNNPAIEEWAQHENGLWFATVYNAQVRAVLVSAPPPTPQPVDVIHTNVNATITADIAGVRYAGSATVTTDLLRQP